MAIACHAPIMRDDNGCATIERGRRDNMTWSIIARDDSGALGVGALCPYARSGVGALSTQALVNPLYAPAALDLMAQRVDPRDITARVMAADDGRDHRQLHMIDAGGRI